MIKHGLRPCLITSNCQKFTSHSNNNYKLSSKMKSLYSKTNTNHRSIILLNWRVSPDKLF